jgi:hypothetical protein
MDGWVKLFIYSMELERTTGRLELLRVVACTCTVHRLPVIETRVELSQPTYCTECY